MVTMSTVFSSRPAFQQLVKQSFSAKVAYRLSKIVRKVDQELQDFEKARVALVEKYARDVDEDGNKTVPPENISMFVKEVEELLNLEVDLDIPLIPLSWLEDVQLTTEQMILIEFAIDPEE